MIECSAGEFEEQWHLPTSSLLKGDSSTLQSIMISFIAGFKLLPLIFKSCRFHIDRRQIYMLNLVIWIVLGTVSCMILYSREEMRWNCGVLADRILYWRTWICGTPPIAALSNRCWIISIFFPFDEFNIWQLDDLKLNHHLPLQTGTATQSFNKKAN